LHPLIIDIFFSFFTSIFNILFFIIAILIGVIVGMILYRALTRPKNQIIYCRERDGRAMELNIAKEDAISLETATKPPLRFFKFGRSYELRRHGRPFTRFFGKEGTAYTWVLEGFHKLTPKRGRPSKNPGEHGKVELSFPSLAGLLKSLWGETFFASVPETQRAELEENKVLVTVNLESGLTPEGYQPITESVIRKKSREDAKDLIGRGLKGAISKDWFERLAWIGAGAGITMFALLLLGVIG